MHDETPLRRQERPGSRRWIWTAHLLFSGAQICRGPARPLPPGPLVLGRDPGEGWRLPDDPLLSRRHAAIERGAGGLRVLDLGSRNGTFVDGRPVDEARVTDGGVIRFGDSFVLFRRVPAQAPRCPPRGPLSALRGDAPAMHRLRRDLLLAAGESGPVLILGESGTGKSLAGRVLHELSGRPGGFHQVNCAAIPDALAESTLFGHVAGAFTGAGAAAQGWFRAASGGTLFIDELADLPLAVQPKLLLAVEAGQVTPVGATRPVRADPRLVAATSVDLDQAVSSGRFRGELLARLSSFLIHLPPLRRRLEDLLLMLATRLDPEGPPLCPELVALLLAWPWPWNVRELLHVAETLRIRGQSEARLGPELVADRLPSIPPGPAASAAGPPGEDELQAALRQAGGVVSEAARRLGRSRRQLYRDLARVGLDPAEFRSS